MGETEDLDKAYSPSMWVTRFPTREELRAHFIKLGGDEYEKSTKEFQCELNIPYGDTPRQKIDLFGQHLPDGAPVFCFIHGGYWQEMSNEIQGFMIRRLVENNIKVMLIDYELCPTVTVSEIVNQVKKGAKFVFDYCKKKMSRGLSFAGHSVGAHLLAYLLHQDFIQDVGQDSFKLLKNLYFISGIYSVKKARHVKAVNENNVLSITDENEDFLSPLFHDFSHLAHNEIKCHVFVGDGDPPIFQEQAEQFYENLTYKSKFQKTDFELYRQLDHFNIIENLVDPDYKMTKLFIEELNS